VPTVGDLMSRELVRVDREASIEDAAELMSGRRVGSALVFDGERLVGILTERDVLRVVGARKLTGATVGEWMTRDPDTVGAEETVEQAGVLMLHGGFRHLPVVEGTTVVGMVSIRDLVYDALSDRAPKGA
jgi:signal-transduction protein with cAMP-binding, CBS, and nucleotidyltransferase domain